MGLRVRDVIALVSAVIFFRFNCENPGKTPVTLHVAQTSELARPLSTEASFFIAYSSSIILCDV